MSKDSRDPIILSGRVFVTSSTVELCPSRELPTSKKKLQEGDLKVWSHFTQRDTNTGAGIFRAAVYDGKKWSPFRLNRVAGDYSRYSSYDDRKSKLAPCIRELTNLGGSTVCWIENSYGIYRYGDAGVVARTRVEPATGKVEDDGSRRKPDSGGATQLTLFD